jgi:hypothetical protein
MCTGYAHGSRVPCRPAAAKNGRRAPSIEATEAEEEEEEEDSFEAQVLSLDMIKSAVSASATNGTFLSFAYVCPEPVLVKSSFLYINGQKSPFFHLRRHPQRSG